MGKYIYGLIGVGALVLIFLLGVLGEYMNEKRKMRSKY